MVEELDNLDRGSKFDIFAPLFKHKPYAILNYFDHEIRKDPARLARNLLLIVLAQMLENLPKLVEFDPQNGLFLLITPRLNNKLNLIPQILPNLHLMRPENDQLRILVIQLLFTVFGILASFLANSVEIGLLFLDFFMRWHLDFGQTIRIHNGY